MNSRRRAGILFMLLMVLGYAFLPTFIKLVYRYSDLRGIDVAGFRFLIAVPTLWLVVYLKGRTRPSESTTERLPRGKLLLLGVGLAGGAVAAAYGLSYIDASIYTILFRTQPIMVIVLNAFLGERFPLRGWIALFVVTLGVVLVLEPATLVSLGSDIDRALVLGVSIAMLNAFVIAVYNIGQQYFMTGYKAKMRATAWTITGTLASILPVVAVIGLQAPPNWQTVAALAGMAIFSTVIPITALFEAIERLGASRAVIIGSVEPLVAVTLAIVLLGEPMLSVVQVVGAVFIISSLFILEGKLPRFIRRGTHPQAAASGD